jgi:hypothetical protein
MGLVKPSAKCAKFLLKTYRIAVKNLAAAQADGQ